VTIDLAALPEDFLWGTATSAYQIEGAVAEDGRSPSIWDTFSHTPGKIDNGDDGDLACDHYHRWREDIEIMRQLGTNAYRLSVAWPRVVPGGDGPVNAKGLDFYDGLIDALLEAGITPSVTLYHWDLPQVLQDRGGWPVRDTAHHFAAYSAVVAERLGDRVKHWTTLNEPLCSAWIGHLEGRMAPGWTDLTAAVQTSYHLLLGHGLATQAIRAAVPGAQVGIVNNLSHIEPATNRPEDVAAARRLDGHTNRWWLDPVHGRGFPADMQEVYGVELPEQPGDKVGADEKTAIEAAAASLKDAVKGEDVEAIKEKTNTLAQASMKLGEAMYKAQQSEAAAGDAAAAGAGNKPEDNVVDADFEEVDDNKKGAA